MGANRFGTAWYDPEYETPKDDLEEVLIIASGTIDNVIYEHAMFLGCFFEDEAAWMIEGVSNSDNLEVELWRYLPANPFFREENT